MSKPEQSLQKAQFVEIDDDMAGQRVDNFLLARLKGVPKSRVYRILRKGEVRVNKGRIRADYRLKEGDLLRIPPIRLEESEPKGKPGQGLVKLLEDAILLETDALMVVNKPAGLAVHGGSGINLGLIEALRGMRPHSRFLELVHRLDRGTSGCILIAKKRSMLRHLQAELREKSHGGSRGSGEHGNIAKVYHALVAGRWPNRRKRIEMPLQRYELPSGDRIVRISPQGKPSLTEFEVLERYRDATLIEARPITGRTHQIRVHAQSVGHPLVGDDKYGDDDFNKEMRSLGFKRLFLHAAALSFCLPGETQTLTVEAPLAGDMVEALARLAPLETVNDQAD